MTSNAPAASAGEPRNLRTWLAPAAVVLALVFGLGTIVFLSSRANTSEAPPEPAAFATPVPVRPVLGFDVRQATPGSFQLASAGQASGQERTLTVTPDIRWEILEPVSEADITIGEWLTVIGVPNAVRAFSIRSVVVFPATSTPGEDGLLRSASGFSGYEAARDPLEKPILSGKVIRLSQREGTTETARGSVPATYTVVTIQTPGGEVDVDLQNGKEFALHRVAPAEAGDVQDGDRLAFAATDGEPQAILILPGGAQ